ncbi:uncharacterized protein LOC104901378 [Beta vulgaris subsp. vulgaris]|uniref:uncharacterized protein LOC104901378 n=1 Tax=Beta vulgaris subsp. vulgaris TaxID=3555 RepID=UPI00053F9167|nr:uncharacterized protein LOC104901378 [Beta vulgaris subsp. vulgaris]
MGDIVDEFQNAFVPGRQMAADNCFISHEITNWVRKKKKGNSFAGILKVDLSKAHDRIRWEFVEIMLRRMNFPEIWVTWIMQCITTVSYSILVNGEPSKVFRPSVGLRQGDPLSSYIFILCMEVLSRNLSKMQNNKELNGLKIARNAPKISHLFFTDDALFFFKANPKNCWAIKTVLATFCEKSGEKINFEKSHVIFSPNTPPKFKKILRKPLGVKDKDKVGSYLGCLMEVDGRTTSVFNDITTKTAYKILTWKFSTLSQAGKLILINTILTALASSIISIYLLPVKTTRNITSLLLKFWWSSSMEKKPIYWRKRELLEKHKFLGGLSFRNVAHVNKALLFNQAWRIHKNKGSLIHKLYTAKYKKDPIQMVMDNEEPKNGSYAFRSLFQASKAFKEGLYKKLGNGRSIRIDNDRWHVNISPKPKVPEIHESRERYVWVSDLIDQNKKWKPSVIWDLFHTRDAREIFATHIPHQEIEDEIGWTQTKSGNYTAKSGYWFLNEGQRDQVTPSNSWTRLWKSDIFPKWKLFLWKIFNKALPTTDNLEKRKINGINNICCLCKQQSESLEHLFSDCHLSQRIWSCSLGIVATNGNHLNLQEWIKIFLNLFIKRKIEEGRRVEIDFIATLWGIWIHRNEVIFKGENANPMRIMSIIREQSMRARKIRKDENSNHIIVTRISGKVEEGSSSLDWTIGDRTTSNVQILVVDGAWKKKAGSNEWQAAIAWKNTNNDPTEESAHKIFANSPTQTEAYAILKAISDMAWRTAGIIILSDSREVILALRNEKSSNQNIDGIIRDIKRIAEGFMFVSCIKVSRSEVRLAHNLATQARKS